MQTDTDAVAQAAQLRPSFNLWDDPWIGVALPDGAVQQVGILECLIEAHRLGPLQDQSPLVVASIHRLLAAILQDIYKPQRVDDIATLLAQRCFDKARVEAYADTYRARFDLFSEDAPFMQSADLPLLADKKDSPKSVAYLFFEEPSGINITHFQHRYENEHSICPACASGGLLVQSAFATAGGRSYKPSINGAPPLYVLPVGDNLFETLSLSLMALGHQPKVRSSGKDTPVWADATTTTVSHAEVLHVSYLESLTFLSRRIRLHPVMKSGICTRCGKVVDVLVSQVHFSMGHYRPAGSPLWRDPFVAYRQYGDEEPTPLRMQGGKALWREYTTLFLSTSYNRNHTPQSNPKRKTQVFFSPAIVNQVADLEMEENVSSEQLLRFRCIGVRTGVRATDQAKVFEWLDASLSIPFGLLQDPYSAGQVRLGIARAERCESLIVALFGRHFGGVTDSNRESQKNREHFKNLRLRMGAAYWLQLSSPFQKLIHIAPDSDDLPQAIEDWNDTLIKAARTCFRSAADGVGSRGSDLRKRVQAMQDCDKELFRIRKEWTDGNREESA